MTLADVLRHLLGLFQAAPPSPRSCVVCFDQSRTSELFSQLNAVLAGFAFAAIVLIIERMTSRQVTRKRRDELQEVLASFTAAFVALVVASVLYALVAAESFDVKPLVDGRGNDSGDLTSPRGVSIYLIAAFTFGLAVLNLFLGILHLLRALNLDVALRRIGWICSPVVPLLALAYVLEACEGVLSFGVRGEAYIAWTSGPLVTTYVGAAAVVVAVFLLVPSRAELRLEVIGPDGGSSFKRIRDRLPAVSPSAAVSGSIGFTVCAALLVALYGRLEATRAMPVPLILGATAVSHIAVVAYASAVRRIITGDVRGAARNA